MLLRFVAALLLILNLQPAVAADDHDRNEQCESALSERQINPAEEAELWHSLYTHIRARLRGKRNPFLTAGADAMAIGEVHERLRQALSFYQEVVGQGVRPQYSLDEYLEIKKRYYDELKKLVGNRAASDDQIFAAAEVIRKLSVIMARTRFDLTLPEPQEGESAEDQNDQSQSQKPGKQKQEQDPWQEDEEVYQPDNKSIEASDGEDKRLTLITTAQSQNRLLRTTIYDVITPEQFTRNPIVRTKRVNPGSGMVERRARMRVFLYSPRAEVQLAIPYGYEPVASSQIKKRGEGEFELIVPKQDDGSTPAHVDVELRYVGDLREYFENPSDIAFYTQRSGLAESLWPESLLSKVRDLKAQGVTDQRRIVEEMTRHIHDNFLYFSKGKAISAKKLAALEQEYKQLLTHYPKVVAMAHLGAVNCDGAALIWAHILRDFFQIPVRVVAGRTLAGRVIVDNETWLASRAADPRHAWGEAFLDGVWVPHDPTPEHLSDDNDKGESSESGRSEEQSNEPSEQEGANSEESEDSQNSENSQNSQNSEDGQESGESQESDDRSNDQPDEQAEQPQEIKGGENQSQARDPRTATDQFVTEIFRLLEESAIETTFTSPEGVTSLKTAVRTLRAIMNEPDRNFHVERGARPVVEDLNALSHQRWRQSDKAWRERIARASVHISQGMHREAWESLKELSRIIAALEQKRRLSESERQVKFHVEAALRSFALIRHQKSEAYDLAERIVRDLPGLVSRAWVRDNYGNVLDLGSPALDAFYHDLTHGKLDALVRLALLHEYREMVVNSTPDSRWGEEKTFDRAMVPKLNNSDVVLAKSPEEFARMLLDPRPGEHIFTKLVRGEQFALGSQETTRVEEPEHPLEQKISIVLYDISGSMQGIRTTILKSLMGVFVDSALSDLDENGQPLHTVILIPFESTPGREQVIATLDDARRYIDESFLNLHAGGGGTNITRALEAAYVRIIAAHKETQGRYQRLLRRANIILFSDGEDSGLDVQLLKRLRDQIPESVTINLNFVGIEANNKELEKLARNSNLATRSPMFRTISMQEMQRTIRESQKPTTDKEAFASDRTAGGAPSEVVLALGQLARLSQTSFLSPVDELAVAERLRQVSKQPGIGLAVPQLVLDLLSQRIPQQATHLPRSARLKVLELVLRDYPRIVGRPLGQLSQSEVTAIERFRTWVEAAR